MSKKNKKKDSFGSKIAEHKESSVDIKEEKVSALGRYMKKVRTQETASDDKVSKGTASRSR